MSDNQKLLELLPFFIKTAAEVAELIARERQRTGMTMEEIFARAGLTLEENEAQLIADIARLGGEAPQG